MAKYVYEGDDKISIDRSCRTCKFNFPAEQIDVIDKKTGKKGYKDSKEKICAGQNRDLEYGQRIKDFKAERKCWDPSMEYLMNLSRRLQKKNNPYLVVKVEALLKFDFNLLRRIGKNKRLVPIYRL